MEQFFKSLSQQILTKLRTNEATRSMAPTLLRLCWHNAGTFSQATNQGGSQGARMRFSPELDWGANKGLKSAMDFLEEFKSEQVSYSDLWTFAGIVSIMFMRGPVIPFKYGRVDSSEASTLPDNLLPDASKDASHLREIFGRMGFTDQEIVVLSGAHAVGRCHPEASGYEGIWTREFLRFSNDYYRYLLDKQWIINQSHTPTQYQDGRDEFVMLPTDIVLIQDPVFRPFVEMYAKDQDLFFRDFVSVFIKLVELGVDNLQGPVVLERPEREDRNRDGNTGATGPRQDRDRPPRDGATGPMRPPRERDNPSGATGPRQDRDRPPRDNQGSTGPRQEERRPRQPPKRPPRNTRR